MLFDLKKDDKEAAGFEPEFPTLISACQVLYWLSYWGKLTLEIKKQYMYFLTPTKHGKNRIVFKKFWHWVDGNFSMKKPQNLGYESNSSNAFTSIVSQTYFEEKSWKFQYE